MTVDFEHRTQISAPVEVVFDLSLDIDAHMASMTDSGERAIGGITSGQIALGEEVTWRARHFGIPFTMTSRITDLDRPDRFVDEQQHGPFRRFHHEHLFESVGDGSVMIDRISFDAPVGVIGRFVERLVLGDYLRKLIEKRCLHIKGQAERLRGIEGG